MKKKSLAVLLSLSLAAVSIAGCRATSGQGEGPADTQVSESMETEPASPPETRPGKTESSREESTRESRPSGEQPGIYTEFKPEFFVSGNTYQPLQFSAQAPEYEIAPDLSNIENMDQFTNLTPRQKEMIAQNGFVVIPTDSEQLFYIYEENAYKKLPGFVTVDSVLQLYHIYYDYTLRMLEGDIFYQDIITLNQGMLEQLIIEYEGAENEQVKESILRVMGYFSVVQMTLGKPVPQGLPREIKSAVEQEYGLISEASGRSQSPLLGVDIDYSLFKVRGHYTRSEELGRYFMAMSWYGVAPIPFYQMSGEREEDSALDAMVMALALGRMPAEKGGKLWENIYSTTSFFVGDSDDITPHEVATVIARVYSENPDIDEFPSKMDEFYSEIEQLRDAEIISKYEGDTITKQMRFMGQRYIPDSEILQKLVEQYQRPFPTGVDVFAVFGSERAEELNNQIYKPQEQWSGYTEAFDKLTEKFRSQTIEEQTSNLYQTWLYCLKSPTQRVGEGYPLFMQNTAWEDKSLSTALGSWAEIRHDTILYGKQSTVECGGESEIPQVVAYVEPNPEFFNRMLWMVSMTKEGLAERGQLSEELQYKTESFENMLVFLRGCAQKELRGEDLSAEEYLSLLTYGGTLEYISCSIADADSWFLVESETDRNMALIADVHSATGAYLEVAVGTAAEIYVAVPQQGKVYLTRGAVFDYHEFVSDQRMTDEEWQEQLKTSEIPPRPVFTDSYMDENGGAEIPAPESPYSSGC